MSEGDAAELIADERFINYCLGNNAEDSLYWETYLHLHPEEAEIIGELKSVVLLTAKAANDLELQTQVENLRQRITSREHSRKRFGIPLLAMLKAVAILAGVLLTGFLGIYLLSKPSSLTPAMASYSTQKAERRTFLLPDGSKVTLNAESELTLSKHFNATDRIVSLHGEAFFDVTHDADNPFIVTTKQVDVKVLGTAFNIKAYDNDDICETSLLRGSITLSLKNEQKTVTLAPNEKYLIRTNKSISSNPTAAQEQHEATVETALLPITVSPKDTAIVEVSWAEDKLIFVDEPFEDLVKQLSRWYGIPIEIKDVTLKSVLYTASFRNEKIEDVLAALQFTRAFHYEIKNNAIMIYQ